MARTRAEWEADYEAAATSAGFSTSISTVKITIKNSGILNIVNTPTYADNTAAAAGGLVAGDVYRTSTGQLMIVF